MRLSRLRREIERHIRLTPFCPSPLILRGLLSMLVEKGPHFAFSVCGAERSGSPRRLKSVRVLIVDDHPIIVSGCRALLEGEPEIEVVEAQDGAAGFVAYFDHKPDVGVVDINLPGYSGLELLRRILEREPEARLVIFSMNDDPTVAPRAIEGGGQGDIAKNAAH